MKKLLTLIFAVTCMGAKAQNYAYKQANNAGISFGVEAPIAVKNQFFSVGAGASVKAEYPVYDNFNVTLTGGYSILRVREAYKNPTGTTNPAAFVPVKGGVRMFIDDKLYFDLELGAALELNYAKRTYYVIALGPGYLVPAGKKANLDFSLRYEDWGSSRIKLLGIRAAYRADWL